MRELNKIEMDQVSGGDLLGILYTGAGFLIGAAAGMKLGPVTLPILGLIPASYLAVAGGLLGASFGYGFAPCSYY